MGKENNYSPISVNVPDDSKEENLNSCEIEEVLEELEYMEKHPEEYKSYKSMEELMKDLLSDDD